MLLRMSSLYRIGVDVGGTNTDAAILDIKAADRAGHGVLASFKTPTTRDITTGIETSIREVLKQSGIDKSHVVSVTIGTTHFINALLEADSRKLDRVATFRLCGPYTHQVPPFSDFPLGLKKVLNGGWWPLDGGFEMDGREIRPLDPEQIRRAVREVVKAGIKVIALIGIFSPMDHQGLHEERCKSIILEEAPHLSVACSHDIGPPGFLERENATILNAAILRTADKVIKRFVRAMNRLQLACPLFLSQNDGTLIEAKLAAEYPVKTFASGTTNSMTGAAFLAGIDGINRPGGTDTHTPSLDEAATGHEEPQVLVIDIGGTSTDCCSLLPSGFPRPAPQFLEVGGVRTAFSMPEVTSIGLGGGSHVLVDPHGKVHVGPSSVGHKLTEEAIVFGGKTLTATDVMVALGRANIGDPSLVKNIPPEIIEGARQAINRLLEELIDRVRVSMAPVHVLLVGGGAPLMAEDLKGVDKCIRPMHQGTANAVGAGIAKVSGEVDVVEVLEGRTEQDALSAACKKASALAIEKGAAPADVHIAEVNKMMLQYMTRVTIRIQVRAVGKLMVSERTMAYSPPADAIDGVDDIVDNDDEEDEEDEGSRSTIPDAHQPTIKPSLDVDINTYRPEVRDDAWYISEVDLEFIATGCGVLGAGGGGQTHHEFLKALQCLRNGGRGKLRAISPRSLHNDDVVYFGCLYGSPSVINERLAGGTEVRRCIELAQKTDGRPIRALFSDEIGGGNGLSNFTTCVSFDVPIIDGDAMGRAYPAMHHATHSVYGCSLVPCALVDGRENGIVVTKTETTEELETLLRAIAIQLGLSCAVSSAPLDGRTLKRVTIPNSLSYAWYLGRAIHQARRQKTSYTDAIFSISQGRLLFSGKIIDVRRHLNGGYTQGSVLIAPVNDEERQKRSGRYARLSPSNNRCLVVPFKNEFLYAAFTDSEGSPESEEPIATVPDIITVLGQDGEVIGTQELRYGLSVDVITLPAHPLWKTEKGLKVGGPQEFGLPMPFIGFDSRDYTEPRSIIEEFGGGAR